MMAVRFPFIKTIKVSVTVWARGLLPRGATCFSPTAPLTPSPLSVPLHRPRRPQVKALQVQLDTESSKRVTAQSELKGRGQETDRLRGLEKQLKQEINASLESKRSLEFQLAQMTK